MTNELAIRNSNNLAKDKDNTKKQHEIVLVFDRSGSMCGTEKFVCAGFEKLIKTLNAQFKGKILLTTVLFDNELKTITCRTPIEEVEPITYEVGGSTALFDGTGSAISYIKDAHNQEKEAFDKEEDEKELNFNLNEDEQEKIFNLKEDANEIAFNKKEEELEAKSRRNVFSKKPYIKRIYNRKSYNRQVYQRKEYDGPDVHIMIYSDGMENASMIYNQTAISELINDCIENGWHFYYFGDFCLDLEEIAAQLNIPIEQTIAFIRDAQGFKNLFGLITGMVKHLALNGYIPENWQDLSESAPLASIKDENIRNTFNTTKKLLQNNENLLAQLEAYGYKKGFDEDFKKIFSHILMNLSKIRYNCQMLTRENQRELVEILKIYFDKQNKHSQLALKAALSQSTTNLASANLINLGGLRNICESNVLNFGDFNKYYTATIDNFQVLESFLKKASSGEFYELYDRLEKLLSTQKEEFNKLVFQTLITRRNYIERIIRSSSNYLFDRDKEKKLGLIETLFIKNINSKENPPEDLTDEIARLISIYNSFKINSSIKQKLSNKNNRPLTQLLQDENHLYSWIMQIFSIFEIPIEQFEILTPSESQETNDESIEVEGKVIAIGETSEETLDNSSKPITLELLPGKTSQIKEDKS